MTALALHTCCFIVVMMRTHLFVPGCKTTCRLQCMLTACGWHVLACQIIASAAASPAYAAPAVVQTHSFQYGHPAMPSWQIQSLTCSQDFIESELTARRPVLCCRNKLGKRKGQSHGAGPSKRAAVRQEVRVTCGSSSGVYDITRGCIALRAAQHGQVCFVHSLFHSFCILYPSPSGKVCTLLTSGTHEHLLCISLMCCGSLVLLVGVQPCPSTCSLAQERVCSSC